MSRRFVVVVVLVIVLAGFVAACAPPPSDPLAIREINEGIVRGFLLENDDAPPGANDPTCRPAPGQVPVVLVHGFLANMSLSWGALSPFLVRQGLCVFALNYGSTDEWFHALDPVAAASMEEIGPFIDDVLELTGVERVDVVGHSLGGVSPRYWMRYGDSVHPDGTPKVRNFIGVAAATNGSDVWGLAAGLAGLPPVVIPPVPGCGACADLIAGSAFLHAVNDQASHPGENFSGPMQPGVTYTQIVTQFENIVSPPASSFLPPPSNNVVVQDGCPIDESDHLSIVYDPRTLDIVRNVIAPELATPLRCVWNRPFFGINPYQTLPPPP